MLPMGYWTDNVAICEEAQRGECLLASNMITSKGVCGPPLSETTSARPCYEATGLSPGINMSLQWGAEPKILVASKITKLLDPPS